MNLMPGRIRTPFVRVIRTAVAATFCTAAHAQTFYGSIVGTVTDASNSPVARAAVAVTSLGTTERRTITTENEGIYRFVNLVPGNYRLDIELAGFKHYTRDQIVVEVEAAVRIDIAMQVGDVSQSVEISAETPFSRPKAPHSDRWSKAAPLKRSLSTAATFSIWSRLCLAWCPRAAQ